VTHVLVDSNVLLDLTTGNSWADWSAKALARLADEADLVINPVIYAEVCGRFTSESQVDDLLTADAFAREPLPYEAAWVAGRLHTQYRRQGGTKERTLPDFLIGAHAAVKGYRLLTRDARRYRTHFPKLEIIAPGLD